MGVPNYKLTNNVCTLPMPYYINDLQQRFDFNSIVKYLFNILSPLEWFKTLHNPSISFSIGVWLLVQVSLFRITLSHEHNGNDIISTSMSIYKDTFISCSSLCCTRTSCIYKCSLINSLYFVCANVHTCMCCYL